MKFLYEYRTSDNAKHTGVIRASDREAAYAELKRNGIKPSRFSEAPGFFNKLFGKGKRWLAIVLLGVLVVVSAFVIHSDNQTIRTIEQAQSVFDGPKRRQLIGDAAIIDKGERDGWSDVFKHDGERFLASFAVPGGEVAFGSTTKEEVEAALKRKIAVGPEDGIEARQIKSIVEGMKCELRAFIADGGSIAQYARLMIQRQEEEERSYRRAKNELERAVEAKADAGALAEIVDRHNAGLRKIGCKLLILPGEER